MRTGDTIVALATPPRSPGSSTHAVLRLSGPRAMDALDHICTQPLTRRRSCAHTLISVGQHTLPATALLFPAPASYTGEDCVDLLLVDNPWLVEQVIAALLSQPETRAAEPGEFSARAYLAGRLTLDQAEGIAALIAARNQDQWHAARELASGRVGVAHQQRASTLAHLLALTEAGIDFTDQEDVVAITPADLRTRLCALIDELQSISAASMAESGCVRVVLVGPPNAGKSTLFNALLGRRRAVTSSQAGTTRDALIEPLDLRPLTVASVELIDLPGLDMAEVDLTWSDQYGLDAGDPAHPPVSELDAQARQQALSVVASADLILRCDPHGHAVADARSLLVRTQADRAAPGSTHEGMLPVCALDGWGLPALRQALADRIETLHSTAAGSRSGVSALQASAVVRTMKHLQNAVDAIDPHGSRLDHLELIADELRSALDAMAPLAGRIEPDEILGLVFASFCIGK
jgi:tRNA modification GTPase